ncbi:hypothetical protein CHS0354_041707 [Potamilus streckersoni]|uniref:Uncharacterized protein n=1 Tax=Potamilus streckersoni TaxID=2493646 RepID=A0AAE0T1Z9_9BIVA|nr:hypothetical protein CHS0354_041707 [Potamilus streckersoni]
MFFAAEARFIITDYLPMMETDVVMKYYVDKRLINNIMVTFQYCRRRREIDVDLCLDVICIYLRVMPPTMRGRVTGIQHVLIWRVNYINSIGSTDVNCNGTRAIGSNLLIFMTTITDTKYTALEFA